MSTDAHPLSGRHREVLRHVFSHPMSHNLEWRQVLALLREVAEVDEQKDGVVEIRATGQQPVFVRRHGKDVDPDDVESIRHLLEALGLKPAAG